MNKVKKQICLLLLLLSLFCILSFSCSAENEISTAAIECDEFIVEIDADDIYLPSNDELFNKKVEDELSSDTPAEQNRRRTSYGGVNGILYEFLKEKAKSVAKGNEDSTIFAISVVDLKLDELRWTAEDLKLATLVYNGKVTQEAANAAIASIGFDLNSIIRTLLLECPYEMYWYNKTTSAGWGGLSVGAEEIDGVMTLFLVPDSQMEIRFPVVNDYSIKNPDGTYIQFSYDRTKADRVNSAVTKASAIVREASFLSDYVKLVYFRDSICDLVSYNDYAANSSNSVPYGDPWQLIYVFDDDPDTNVVCEGYSKAFKFLCDKTQFEENVTCIIATGLMGAYRSGDSGISLERHMWNIIKIDNSDYYLVDVTNCDENTIGAFDKLFMQGYDGVNGIDYQYICSDRSYVLYRFDEEIVQEHQLTLPNDLSDNDYAVSGPLFRSHSLVLSGQIGVNFFVDLSKPEGLNLSSVSMDFTVNGRTKTVPFSESILNETTGCYGFTCYVSSVQMADEITAVLNYSGGSVTQTYSVAEYVDYVLSHSSSFTTRVVDLVSALADYGHYVQPFLSVNNGWRLNDDHSVIKEVNSYSSSVVENARDAVSGRAIVKDPGSSQIEKVTYALNLESETEIWLYLKVKPGYEGTITASIGDNALDCILQNDGRYLIIISNISANKLGDIYEIEVTADGKFTIYVSALSYVNTVLNSDRGVFDNDTAHYAAASLYYLFEKATA